MIKPKRRCRWELQLWNSKRWSRGKAAGGKLVWNQHKAMCVGYNGVIPLIVICQVYVCQLHILQNVILNKNENPQHAGYYHTNSHKDIYIHFVCFHLHTVDKNLNTTNLTIDQGSMEGLVSPESTSLLATFWWINNQTFTDSELAKFY